MLSFQSYVHLDMPELFGRWRRRYARALFGREVIRGIQEMNGSTNFGFQFKA